MPKVPEVAFWGIMGVFQTTSSCLGGAGGLGVAGSLQQASNTNKVENETIIFIGQLLFIQFKLSTIVPIKQLV
jgi:hypothetical protein